MAYPLPKQWYPTWHPPKPGNDNHPFRPRPRPSFGKKVPKAIPARLLPKVLPRVLPRLIPGLGLILTAIDVLDMILPEQSYQPPGFRLTGWRLVHGPFNREAYAGHMYYHIWSFQHLEPWKQAGTPYPSEHSIAHGSQLPYEWWNDAQALGGSFVHHIRYPKPIVTHAQHSSYARDYRYSPSGQVVPGAPELAKRPAILPELPNFSNAHPMALPIYQYAGLPVPLPLPLSRSAQPNPDLSPHESTVRGPVTSVSVPALPWLPLPILPVPVTPPPPLTKPGATDSIEIVQWQDSKVPEAPAWRPGGHVRQNPPKGEKERKMTVNDIKLIKWIGDTFGKITEVGDMIDAAYKALPKERRGGYWYSKEKQRWMPKDNYKVRARKVYEHFEEIDLDAFMANLLKNQYEDFIIGQKSKALHRTLKPFYNRVKAPVGIEWRGWGAFG